MREQIFLGGVPTVGFGDADISIANPVISRPIIGFFIGSITGAFIGDKIHRGFGTGAGAILGGVGGTVAGAAWVVHTLRVEAAEKKRLQEQQAAAKP